MALSLINNIDQSSKSMNVLLKSGYMVGTLPMRIPENKSIIQRSFYFINQSKIWMYPKVGTKWVHSGYNDSGILRKCKKEKSLKTFRLRLFQAGPTRLELATSCVTGRRSNQLNYDPSVQN